MSLFEVMQWLGRRYAESTMNYLKTSPTKLAKAFSDADYFRHNLRSIEALIDQEVIRSGAAVAGSAWKFYDLGHGYCAYDFFDQCRRRMVCAKCDFYLPKESGRAQILEVKGNLQRMIQEIPLREEERAAVEGGLAALEKLTTKLANVQTPAGPTPSELGAMAPVNCQFFAVLADQFFDATRFSGLPSDLLSSLASPGGNRP
jgi:hypothetical protein